MQTSLDFVDYIGDDFSFTLDNITAHQNLKHLKTLVDHPQIKKAETMAFYFSGFKLNWETSLRHVLKRFQKDDRGRPVTIYCAEVAFHLFSARQLKDHFQLLYLKEDLGFYDSAIARQRIEFEREKLRKLKEVY
jgi:hypothetical protein